jgi:hypothetical protein
MARVSKGWVVYEYDDGQFVHLSKPFKTKEQAEKKRSELTARLGNRQSPIGVGFVLIPQ